MLPQLLVRMSCWAAAHPSSALLVAFRFVLLINIELIEDGTLGAADKAGRTAPHQRVVSLCVSDDGSSCCHLWDVKPASQRC